jgi:hypothetical protein
MDVSANDMWPPEGDSGRRNAQATIKEYHHANETELHDTALAIIAAPIASAADTGQSCGQSGTGTVCESPGNVQINDTPPPVGFYPYGGDAFLLGGYGGGFHGGGFHGGGHR